MKDCFVMLKKISKDNLDSLLDANKMKKCFFMFKKMNKDNLDSLLENTKMMKNINKNHNQKNPDSYLQENVDEMSTVEELEYILANAKVNIKECFVELKNVSLSNEIVYPFLNLDESTEDGNEINVDGLEHSHDRNYLAGETADIETEKFAENENSTNFDRTNKETYFTNTEGYNDVNCNVEKQGLNTFEVDISTNVHSVDPKISTKNDPNAVMEIEKGDPKDEFEFVDDLNKFEDSKKNNVKDDIVKYEPIEERRVFDLESLQDLSPVEALKLFSS